VEKENPRRKGGPLPTYNLLSGRVKKKFTGKKNWWHKVKAKKKSRPGQKKKRSGVGDGSRRETSVKKKNIQEAH